MDQKISAGWCRGSRRWGMTCGTVTLLLAAASLLLPIAQWIPPGALTGFLLLIAGLAELLTGFSRPQDRIRRALFASSFITLSAGLVLLVGPLISFFPVATIVMWWLLVRGGGLLAAARVSRRKGAVRWIFLMGAADILLGVMLAMGMPVAAFVASLFGPTFELVASFALVLAVSFAVTGVVQIRLALLER